jgi:hypothetical protein
VIDNMGGVVRGVGFNPAFKLSFKWAPIEQTPAKAHFSFGPWRALPYPSRIGR